jgi:hypothetical protein
MELKELSNTDLVVFAVYLLGGDRQFVNTEDVAVHTANLAPGRFNWKRHPDQIDMGLIQKSLSMDKRNGSSITGSIKGGWMLTEHGLEFVETLREQLPNPGPAFSRLTDSEKRFHPWHKKRIQAHPVYKKVIEGLSEEITAVEAEKFFLLRRDMDAGAKAERVNFYVRCFEYDPAIGPVVNFLAGKVGRRKARTTSALR